METTSDNRELIADVWQKLPPEEKLNLFAEAKATGLSTVVISFIFATAIAIGLKTPWVLWGTFFVLPIAFQIAAGKAWRVIKPKAVVEYSAARATACFFASKAGGKNLIPLLVFKGVVQRQGLDTPDDDLIISEEELENRRAPRAAWVALFADSVVIFSESPLGAVNEFSRSLLDEFSLTTEEPEDLDEPLTPKALILSAKAKDGEFSRWSLTSSYGGTFSTFERRLRSALTHRDRMAEEAIASSSREPSQEAARAPSRAA